MADYEYADLTKNQQRLIDGLLSDMTNVEAYKQAYPNSKMNDVQMGIEVANMIKNKDNKFPKFSLVYQKMKAEVDEKAKEASIATAVEILQFYTSLLRNEVKEEVPMVVNTGDFCSEVKMVEKGASLKDRKTAADALAKHYGIMTDKVSLDIAPVVIKDDVPDDES